MADNKDESEIKEKDKKELTKEEKNEIEAEELYAKVTSGDLKSLKEKVGWILNRYPSARNSDVTCQIKYWNTFESEYIVENKIELKSLYDLTRLNAITRVRAKIQNEYKLFLADDDIRQHRGKLEETQKEWAINDQPDYPNFTVFIDESGKTQKNVIVGSLWIVDSFETLKMMKRIKEIKGKYKSDRELHFKNMKVNEMDKYYEILDVINDNATSLCFKAISVEREGIKNIQDAITKLTSYLVIEGIKHEDTSGRAPLPRTIQIIKDQEEVGFDKIMLKEVRERLEIEKDRNFKDRLFIDEFKALDSSGSEFLQITDLFVASLNRMINVTDGEKNHKYDFAKSFLEKFGVEIEDDVIKNMGDIIKKFDV